MKMNKVVWLGMVAVLGSLGSWAEDLAGNLGMVYDTKYVSEGRDNLEKGGLVSGFFSLEKETALGGFVTELWYGSSVETPYTEMDLSGGWSKEVADGLAIELVYTYLSFPQDDSEDHEVAIGLSKEFENGFTPYVAGVYSVDAEGSFWEVGGIQELSVSEKLTLMPYAFLAMNEGYVAEGHSGLNNVGVGVEGEYVCKECLSLVVILSASFPLDKDEDRYADDASLDDLYWASVGLVSSF